MAAPAYPFAQFSADLKKFNFESAATFDLDRLRDRHRYRIRRIHSDVTGGSDDAAKELNAARDRLRRWHEGGQQPFADQPRPQPGYADTAAAAAQREADRATRAQQDAEAKARQEAREAAAPPAGRTTAAREAQSRQWGRLALLPLRVLGWAFVRLPSDRVPLVVVALLIVFGWPFLQDSRFGQYVPRLPSIYAWFAGTEAIRFLTGGGQWVNNPGGRGLCVGSASYCAEHGR